MSYQDFISGKETKSIAAGFDPDERTYPAEIKDHQRASVTWACRRGRAALFLSTGLGKTLAQITWADQVVRHTGGSVLILAPLAVSHQTIREGYKFGIDVQLAAERPDIDGPGIFVSNYEKISHFDPEAFAGIVLDESSILKGIEGKMRRHITEAFAATQYKLSCTATPSPNDYMELGTQSEFLGIMSQVEMLAMFFIHDGSDTSKWRLKGHGKTKFWEWLSTWALFMQTPADIGLDGNEYELPPIHYHNHTIETDPEPGSLFVTPAQSLVERNRARKNSIDARCKKAADIVNGLQNHAVIWCHLNEESRQLTSLISDAIEVKGADHDDHKTLSMLDFADGNIKALVTKPKIAGFGMNWQSSHHCVFVGLSDSWESFYQAIRRQWRFGQHHDVNVHIVSADTEGAVVENIRRKDRQHEELSTAMMDHMRDLTKRSVFGAVSEKANYQPEIQMNLPEWLLST